MSINTTNTSLKVGFIGLGDQGAPMAVAIAAAKFSLQVWARRPASLAALGDAPHTSHASVAELGAACDIVALCLTEDRDLLDILGPQGLQAALRPGAIVVNHGTGDPDENKRLADRLQKAGLRFLDAPVSGGGLGAVARTLTTIVGGDAATLADCRAVFDSFSRKVVLMGPAGSGQLGKLLNNALTMSNLDNAAQVMGMAEKLGLDVPAVAEMVGASSGASFILAAAINFTPELARHLQGLMEKDIDHFADGMRSSGVDSDAMHARGVHGARSLVALVERLQRPR